MLLNLKILRAEIKQASEISNLILPMAVAHFKPIISSFRVASIAEFIQNPAFSYFVAEIQDSICGVIALRDNKHIYHLFVDTKYQGQGIARALWEHAKFDAEKSGNKGSFTVNSSINAVTVYKRFGFNEVSDKQEKNGIYFVPMQFGCE